ncbi:uncharacterized protein LOC111638900 isoform X1 [Centruroides sculpturatus]|uniref:uncharacterized protein LOC111638900 isoform X1 n=1 Tax=Centruroides sculpturatus TaxID=218467 RepID=UPI000C6D2F50|nr:uncharacterized protein LOC111638900 isoform X1 [Centruroides sculpturatus]
MKEPEPNHQSQLKLLKKGAFIFGDSKNPPDQPPPWLDKERFYRARVIFKKYFFSIFFIHLSGLMLTIHLPSMLPPLLATGKSANLMCLFQRYLSTMLHIRRWYEGDVWNPEDPAHKSIITVRKMHKRVADRLNDSKEHGTCPLSKKDVVYVSQYDMAIAQFAFIGLAVLYPTTVGITCSKEDLECLIHFWRGVGYLLGMEDRFNLCQGTYEETTNLCREILEEVVKPAIKSSPKETTQMSRNVVKALNSFIIFLSWEAMAKFWFQIIDLPTDFAMAVMEKTGFWLMWITFRYILRVVYFHVFFNFLLRFTLRYVVVRKLQFENYLRKYISPAQV